jgi:hypothetical protein
MEASNTESLSTEPDVRREFLRDAAVFQGKLLVDGLRDLILFPATLVAAGIDFFTRSEPVGRYFYEVLHFGKETERWIDLFEAADRAPETERPGFNAPSLDELVDQLEKKLKAERETGEMSAAAKRAIERVRDAAKRAMNGGE